MQFRPGDYVCVSLSYSPWHDPTAWFFNSLIKNFTHSKFSHAFVVVDTEGTIVEARPKGAAKSNISEYAGFTMIGSNTVMTDEQRKKVCANAVSYIGTPYGFADIMYLAAYTHGIQNSWIFEEVTDIHAMICSQLVATAGVNAGLNSWLCGKPDPQLVVPGDLAALAFS